MKLSAVEFALMNNPIRALSQRILETPGMFRGKAPLAGKRVLEIGCGRGVGVEILFRLGAAHVTAFDLDPRMIERAQKRLARHSDRVNLSVGDVEAIAAPDAAFDAVVDYGILHHVPDWRKGIGEVARVLKSGGTFHFEEPLSAMLEGLLIASKLDHPQSARFSASEFRGALEAAGLRIIHWQQIGQAAQAFLDEINEAVRLARKGHLANTLTPSVGDANIQTPEYKAFLVDIHKA